MPIGIKISARFDGRKISRMSESLKIELEKARNESLELTRKTLRAEAPSTKKGHKYSKNKIVRFLRAPSRCIRKIGRYSGYVFLNQQELPHLRYVIKSAGKDKWNIPKGCVKGQYKTGKKWLYFWWLRKKTYFLGPCVTRFRHKSNNFITGAWLKVRGPVYNITKKHFLKAVKMG